MNNEQTALIFAFYFVITAILFSITSVFGIFALTSKLKSKAWNIPHDVTMYRKFAFWRTTFTIYIFLSLLILIFTK